MINVKIEYLKTKFRSFLITGHANYDAHGKDLVCAGVSAIISGSINAFDKMCNDSIKIIVNDNLVKIDIFNYKNDIQLLFKMLYFQLKTIEIQYPKNLEINEKEVS